MIKVKGLSYVYKDGSVALKNMTLDFNNGNVIGIIGENGAGKSTLFLNIMGILKPGTGEILYKDSQISYDRNYLKNYRKKIGIVFQDPDKQIFFSNVYDDIAFALRNSDIPEDIVKNRVLDALEDTDLLEVQKKPVHFLSYGQKKRVSIAGAMAMDCEIILFDEPSAGLDPSMREKIINIIHNLKSEGKKVIISSHDMDFIYKVTDYIYVLKDGSNVLEGDPSEVFLNDDKLKECGLEQPWLIKIHQNMKVPAFKEEYELYKYWSEINENSNNWNGLQGSPHRD
ncbi:energy-coupling factor ABC transporter ATP-binding protein [Alkalibacter mobilis]|uniref:energy-coupling factor ABC transporter ATP-binding protein n=1 Tax=Alkalibacter mobilis TaxID=2787712 RepID=UPI00189D8D81|nr:ATP-binding cassette domain-containing protein [Alkalibacter mobilis]MBF7097162.1 ATP-binding cassette domain-containing protein [Alkalibacter mobilis]